MRGVGDFMCQCIAIGKSAEVPRLKNYRQCGGDPQQGNCPHSKTGHSTLVGDIKKDGRCSCAHDSSVPGWPADRVCNSGMFMLIP